MGPNRGDPRIYCLELQLALEKMFGVDLEGQSLRVCLTPSGMLQVGPTRSFVESGNSQRACFRGERVEGWRKKRLK